MKQKFFFSFYSVMCAVLLFTSCKKSDSTSNDTVTDEQVAVQADDESMASTEIEAVTADINLAVESSDTFSGNYSVLNSGICDAIITADLHSDPMTVTITYNGQTCSSAHTRTGVIVLSMAKSTNWISPGSFMTITYQNIKITRTSDGKSLTLNGTQTYTNVSGGLLNNLVSEGTITHTITSDNMSVAFDNGSARTWSIARQRTYTYNNGIVLSITGIHTEGDNNNIADWGTNRFGRTFTTMVDSPLVFKQSCDFRLTAGAVTHSTNAYTATVNFGLDATGTATGCPGDGHYYYKLQWTIGNNSPHSVILPY